MWMHTTLCYCCYCHTKNPPKKKEFCTSIIVATKWLWSSFTAATTAPAIVIPIVVALITVNRWMTGWMKCSSGWMTIRVD
jgi:hypothetical protein